MVYKFSYPTQGCDKIGADIFPLKKFWFAPYPFFSFARDQIVQFVSCFLSRFHCGYIHNMFKLTFALQFCFTPGSLNPTHEALPPRLNMKEKSLLAGISLYCGLAVVVCVVVVPSERGKLIRILLVYSIVYRCRCLVQRNLQYISGTWAPDDGLSKRVEILPEPGFCNSEVPNTSILPEYAEFIVNYL